MFHLKTIRIYFHLYNLRWIKWSKSKPFHIFAVIPAIIRLPHRLKISSETECHPITTPPWWYSRFGHPWSLDEMFDLNFFRVSFSPISLPSKSTQSTQSHRPAINGTCWTFHIRSLERCHCPAGFSIRCSIRWSAGQTHSRFCSLACSFKAD